MLGAVICFSACSDDDELTQEEKDAKQAKELIEQITENYTTITSKKWSLKEYQPSEALKTAAANPDNTDANSRMAKINHVGNFNMQLSFASTSTDSLQVNVDVNLSDEEIDAKLKEYQDAIYPDFKDWGFILGKESTLASFRRVIAAPFAADKLTIDEITNEETGLTIFKVIMSKYEGLLYDDVVLAQRKIIADNDDKIYLNEDGTLTVESTHKDYGVSKLIMEEVKN